MNVNCKLTLTDEQRNTMFRRLTGKATKGMVSRADVCNWVNEQLERFLTLGSPETEQIGDKIADAMQDSISYSETNIDDIDVAEVLRQNELLLSRINVLQHRLDTRR